MELRELPDKKWKTRELDRFLKNGCKLETEDFDPASFSHEGFENWQKYVEDYVPALRDPVRLDRELNRFRPPRLRNMNDSPYQALVLRYGVLRTLIKQLDYQMEKTALLEEVQQWQCILIDEFDEDSFNENDDLLHLAQAAVDYQSQINDSELHLIYSYFELHNDSQERKHNYYTWLDFFKRLSSIDQFPKISRSDSPAHAIDTIKQGL